jgi:hypothetical protein
MRRAALNAIMRAIADRRLLWVGTRGTDAQPLLQIEQFRGVFGLIAPLGVPSWDPKDEEYLERLTGERIDLDGYRIDEDDSTNIRKLHGLLKEAMKPQTIVAAYRPTAFLTAAYYPRMEHTTYLGMFHGLQGAFEHKPWVETELRAHGVPTIQWQYFTPGDREVMRERMGGQDCVVRANYSDGGIGLVLSRAGDDREAHIPQYSGGFLAFAPMLEPSVPLNVGGCVFRDGTVTVRHPSLQLIGVPVCTARRFGYCGNDFAAVADVLGRDTLDRFEAITRRAGKWLFKHGYLGAFGLDALLCGDDVCLTEVNPRFQGSSAAAASIASRLDLPDIYLDHLSATLGLKAPKQLPLHEQAREQAAAGQRLSQVVCYNTDGPRRRRADAVVPDLDYGDIKGTPEVRVLVHPNAMLFKVFVDDQVTTTGSELPSWLVADIGRITSQLYESVPPQAGGVAPGHEAEA